MNSKILMINDWVELSECGEKHSRVREIYSTVTSNPKRMVRVVNTLNYCLSEDNISPVPLTVRILYDNGFRSADKRYYVLKSNPRIGWDKETHNLIIGYADTGKTIDYVHQIQQVLRLLTDRKDIADNFKLR